MKLPAEKPDFFSTVGLLIYALETTCASCEVSAIISSCSEGEETTHFAKPILYAKEDISLTADILVLSVGVMIKLAFSKRLSSE